MISLESFRNQLCNLFEEQFTDVEFTIDELRSTIGTDNFAGRPAPHRANYNCSLMRQHPVVVRVLLRESAVKTNFTPITNH